MATIKDVAEYAGVAISTVSKYINGGNVLEENKILIDEAIDNLNYRVNEIARGLKTNKTMAVGVLIPSFEDDFCTTIVSYIEDVLQKNGYSLVLCDYKKDKDTFQGRLEFLLNKMVDGLIIFPLEFSKDIIKKLKSSDIPMIIVDQVLEGIEFDTIVTDNIDAAYKAVNYLIENNHEKIGIICGTKGMYTSEERLKGYTKAHIENNLQVDKAFIRFGDYGVHSGHNAFMDLIDLKEAPTAVLVTNYEMTLGTIMAINERNIIIPDDISLIGFDNIEMAKVIKPSLSIVVQPMQEIGEKAASLLINRLNDEREDFPAFIKLKSKLLRKNSVAKVVK